MAKTKNKFSKRMYKIFMVSFISAVGIYISTSYNKYCDLDAQEKKLASQISQEEERTVLLNSEIELNKSDAYIEKMARERLGYLKSNEIMYVNRSK